MKCLLVFLFGLSMALDDCVVQEFTDANNLEFTPAVYKELVKVAKCDNFLVSPFSAATLLASIQSGSRGETARELRNAVRLPDGNEKIESAFKTLLPTLKPTEIYALYTANKMYVRENLTLSETFKNKAVEVYRSELENINFKEKEEATEKINGWVGRQTNNKIRDILKPENFDEDTSLALINALYFKANWSNPFMLSNTEERKVFYRGAMDLIPVKTMHFFGENLKYYECPHLSAKFLELPFEGADASMTFVLPNEREGLAALENQIDRVFIPHNLTCEVVNVALPKFKVESEIDFKDIMENFGVRSAFCERLADLRGIAGSKGDLAIDVIRQKTFIDVSEEGVEAAAANLFFVHVNDSLELRPPPKNFIANHPFVFYVKIKGIIAFAGRVISPTN